MNAVKLLSCGAFTFGGLFVFAFGYIAVRAMYGIVACSVIPIAAFFNGFPFFFCTVKCYACKAPAIVERISAYTRYAVRYDYARKTTAIFERLGADTCNAIRYGYARKTTATVERRITDTRYAVGYGYARKTTATGERRITDTR